MKQAEVDRILDALPSKTIAVVGDFCLDRYFHLDPSIEDRSVETGLPIHQIMRVRSSPGGGGNVLSNVAALGVGTVLPVGFVGRDGEGYELRGHLAGMGISFDYLVESESRPTPAFIKPLAPEGVKWRETSRYDIFPREPLSGEDERRLLERLEEAFERADALIVSDYWETGKEGGITPVIRERAMALARDGRDKPVFTDSRRFIDEFRHVYIKPNEKEAARFLGAAEPESLSVGELGKAGCDIAGRNSRTVYLTIGERGMLVCGADDFTHIPAFPVEGEIDIVGAGDTVVAAVTAALAAGASGLDAGLFGVLAASITVQQVDTTGVARPEDIRRRFIEYAGRFPELAGT